MKIKRVGVVGCGLMGSGIAEVCARSDYEVVVSEANDELLAKGLSLINSSLAKGVERGKVTLEGKSAAISRIRGTTDIKDFSSCDLVIEAVTEDMSVKKKVFAELDKVCPKYAVLASNTSCLSIIDMAMVTSKPDKVLGLHFSNPVPIIRGLEIVKAITTSDETLNIAITFGKSLGKEIAIAPDIPGFITNRLLIPYLLNAIRLVESGYATKEDIDKQIVTSLNHPMGPITLADLLGLDTIHFVASSMYEELKVPELAPPPLLRRMVSARWLGRKTGKGFYEY
ncbi:MAG TPA: 3-hydroxybutyryl-CoA dehydrogenase [Dehalococcoidia bacterium]|nr:3-hydroxybutyryl-CoA dehydrogenase [Dehalococcoidia bacterium]